MSGKRQATTVLNHDNWNEDLEPEHQGTFARASETELKNRVIKKARRKVETAEDAGSEGANKSIFSGFSGFGSAAASNTKTVASAFSFLSKLPAANAAASSAGSSNTPAKYSFGDAATTTSAVGSASVTQDTKNNSSSKDNEKSANYYANVRGLNQAVSEWIKTHVDKNPLCILTPIFKDYEKYLADIEREESNGNTAAKCGGDKESDKLPVASSSSAGTATSSSSFTNFKFSAAPTNASNVACTSTTTTTTSIPASSAPIFSFGTTATSTNSAGSTGIFSGVSKPSAATSEQPKTNGFSFGLKAGATSPPKGFSFGLKSDDKSGSTAAPPTSSFSFGKTSSENNSAAAATDKKAGFSFTSGATPFTFGNIQPPPATAAPAANAEEEDAEDQPPKVEFKQVVENDAVFSKKCKVFVKKDGNFADRGVGTIYLKPVKDSEKTQLIVRADTNLGNVLVNLILSTGIPTQRMGKNNVMMVCIPTPDIEKPTSLLLRVKTGEEADELLEIIEKYKK